MREEAVAAVFVRELRDLHSAETQLAGLLPTMWEKAGNGELAQTLRGFLRESFDHGSTLATILVNQGTTFVQRPWKGMASIVDETLATLADASDPATRDLLLINGCQRIKGLKIAVYGTARSLAERLDEHQSAELLQTILVEEMEGDLRLFELAHELLQARNPKHY